MKKTLLCLFGAMLLFFIMPLSALAATATVSGSSLAAQPGQTVEFTVSLEDNPGLAAFLLYIDCDTDVFSAGSSGSYQIDKGDFSTAGALVANTHQDRGWQAMWYNTQNVTANGTLLTVQLTVSPDAAAGSYPISIGYSPENTVNVNGEPVSLTTQAGTITVSGAPVAPATPTTPVEPEGDAALNGDVGDETAGSEESSGDSNLFSDLPRGHWAYGYVKALVDRGIVDGVGDDRFAPDKKVTRAEFVKMLAGVAGASAEVALYSQSSFNDVRSGDWFLPYVAWAADMGYVKGRSNGSFGPNDKITRQEIAAVIWRLAQQSALSLPQGEAASFSDQRQISDYAQAAVLAVFSAGIISGYSDNSFRPQQPATRAETAKMLAKLMELSDQAKLNKAAKII